MYRHAHLATSLPTLLRRVDGVNWRRQRISLVDGDFLDLDFSHEGPPGDQPTVVLCHGLEGNTGRQYMLGMARAFAGAGWQVVGMNYRGCSGEPNRRAFSYHSGATEDLREVLDQLAGTGHRVAALVGFSLGGNLILKYLGEDPAGRHDDLRAAVVFSVPIDLADGERQLRRRANVFYRRRFLRKLIAKTEQKAEMFPDQIDRDRLARVRNLWDFDEFFTGPLSGYAGAEDYYRRCSSRQFLPRITLPTLLVSAQDDPFLGPRCYPVEEAEASSCFHLEMPRHGGHVGFRLPGGLYYSEQRAVAFVQSVVG
jgi:predicted alpha/beta-fold hydrolase